MMLRSVIVLVLVASNLAACAVNRSNSLSAEALEPLKCQGQEQCALYWKRAQLWVARNSTWKIQNATDVVITTYTPAAASTAFGYQVIREPADSGSTERISISPNCANLFGCGDLDAVIVSFKRYVRGLAQ